MSVIVSYKNISPKFGKDVFLAPGSAVVGDVTIGSHSLVNFNAVVRGDYAKVELGEYCDIQEGAIIHVMADTPCKIGNNVIIGHNAIIHAQKIGDNCVIGLGSIILGYTEIGHDVVIMPGTVIESNRKIPSNSLVQGNPAVIVRGLREDELDALAHAAQDIRKTLGNYQIVETTLGTVVKNGEETAKND